MTLVHQICSSLLDRLAGVAEGLIGAPVVVQKGSTPSEPRQWVVEITVEGSLQGVCQVAIGHDAAEALTAVVTGIEGDIPPASVVDTLREMVLQAISADVVALVDAGVQLTPVNVVLRQGVLSAALIAGGVMTGPSLKSPVAVHVHATLMAGGAMTELDPGEIHDDVGSVFPIGSRIDVILDIDLPVTVRFGHTLMPIRALTRLGLGSVIDLGRSPDDPVEVLVGDRVVARGEVVIVGGNYGVRILDVVTPSERLRTMEK